MKKLTYLLMLLLISLFLLLGACGDDDEDDGLTGIPEITPENYDWEIYFMDFSDMGAKVNEYVIWADWLGDSAAITEEDMFTIKIDENLYEFWGGNYEGEWSYHTMAELEPGIEYAVEFFKNGTLLANTNLRMAYSAAVDFPSTFDPTESAYISWEMDGDNQYQVAILESYNDDNWDDESYEEKVLSPSAREYTYPANTVENYGPATEYFMDLLQFNFKKSDRFAFSSSNMVSMYYDGESPARLEAPELRNKIKRVLSKY